MAREFYENEEARFLSWTKLVLAAFVAVAILSLGMCSMEQVDNGKKGVLVNYGRPTGMVGPGLHFLNPFTTEVIQISTQRLKWSNATAAYTKDVQQADVQFTVSYSLDPKKVLWTYQNIGEGWADALIPQVVYQSIKDVFGQSEAVKDTINNRALVQQRIEADLKRRLAARNIRVHGFELTDISFSDAFENAVEAKQVAVENANAERNRTVSVQERANQRVIAAEADARAMRIKTEALAGNAKLVEYEAVQKWDGRLPQNMYGGGAIPFIQAN